MQSALKKQAATTKKFLHNARASSHLQTSSVTTQQIMGQNNNIFYMY